MRAFLAIFVLQHAVASGACCASAPSAKLALVRAGTLHPFGLLLSDMSKKKGHLGRTTKRGQVSKAGTQQPSQLAARDRCASLEPVAQLEPTVAPPKPDHRPIWLSPTSARPPSHRRRRLMLGKKDKVGLGKKDERQAQHDSAKFEAMILKIVRYPASGRSDSRVHLSAHPTGGHRGPCACTALATHHARAGPIHKAIE
ncbi:hypothetical protein T492DRAFT_887725 [Pavlovales sp. CCMP2436]|nr:hypothetical protein T492DRAFT_887725 [Pavlovales sp. CCMP2436]